MIYLLHTVVGELGVITTKMFKYNFLVLQPKSNRIHLNHGANPEISEMDISLSEHIKNIYKYTITESQVNKLNMFYFIITFLFLFC